MIIDPSLKIMEIQKKEMEREYDKELRIKSWELAVNMDDWCRTFSFHSVIDRESLKEEMEYWQQWFYEQLKGEE